MKSPLKLYRRNLDHMKPHNPLTHKYILSKNSRVSMTPINRKLTTRLWWQRSILYKNSFLCCSYRLQLQSK